MGIFRVATPSNYAKCSTISQSCGVINLDPIQIEFSKQVDILRYITCTKFEMNQSAGSFLINFFHTKESETFARP